MLCHTSFRDLLHFFITMEAFVAAARRGGTCRSRISKHLASIVSWSNNKSLTYVLSFRCMRDCCCRWTKVSGAYLLAGVILRTRKIVGSNWYWTQFSMFVQCCWFSVLAKPLRLYVKNSSANHSSKALQNFLGFGTARGMRFGKSSLYAYYAIV